MIILLVSYILGSINCSIIVSKIISGDDIRQFGSGNPGSTNMLRTYGKIAGVTVFIGDIAKAILSFMLAKYLFNNDNLNLYLAGVGVILGHNFPIFHGFRGGKGVAVSLISILFINPIYGGVAVCLGILTILLFRFVSLGFIVGAIAFFVVSVIQFDWKLICFAAFVLFFGLIKHRSNIKRLLNGTERKIGGHRL